MKKVYIFAGITILVTAFFVLDYFSVFGTTSKSYLDFYELNFKTVDEDTGAPVVDVHVRCFQKNNENACTQKKSHKTGYVSVNIPFTKLITTTLFFQKDVSIVETRDPKVHIMFIHNDYKNPVETVYVEELPKLSGQEKIVTMPRHILYK